MESQCEIYAFIPSYYHRISASFWHIYQDRRHSREQIDANDSGPEIAPSLSLALTDLMDRGRNGFEALRRRQTGSLQAILT